MKAGGFDIAERSDGTIVLLHFMFRDGDTYIQLCSRQPLPGSPVAENPPPCPDCYQGLIIAAVAAMEEGHLDVEGWHKIREVL